MWDKLVRLAAERGIVLQPEAAGLYAEYFVLLTTENRRQNLTRITGPGEVLIKHFLDSLELLAWLPEPRGRLLDVGSGAGLPGIPLKIARPSLALTLLDASKKRVHFLQEVSRQLGLREVTVIHGRAEDMARQPEYRDQFEIVVSRAVARLNVLLEICLPFTRPGGYFIAYKGREAGQELFEAGRAATELRSRLCEKREYRLPEGMGERSLLIFSKEAETPAKYPRKAGVPEKRPIPAG